MVPVRHEIWPEDSVLIQVVEMIVVVALVFAVEDGNGASTHAKIIIIFVIIWPSSSWSDRTTGKL